ncbi:hypothetical protein T01_3350 [Trichinella spiralis]|uniref:Uncharacterized protein n=1 Tax=Trichinella spiralis TaxID=6334 RepID=A0A0V1BVL4_TRISP|nr:hypothetical protein T01_3350 [Trichinella spiralis]
MNIYKISSSYEKVLATDHFLEGKISYSILADMQDKSRHLEKMLSGNQKYLFSEIFYQKNMEQRSHNSKPFIFLCMNNEKSAGTQSNTQWENNYCVLELLVGKRSGQASASVFHYSSSYLSYCKVRCSLLHQITSPSQSSSLSNHGSITIVEKRSGQILLWYKEIFIEVTIQLGLKEINLENFNCTFALSLTYFINSVLRHPGMNKIHSGNYNKHILTAAPVAQSVSASYL